MTVTTGGRVGAAAAPGGARGGIGREWRNTHFRLAAWTVALGLAIGALLGATVSALTVAQGGTASVAQRAAIASNATDLYFSLSDLDAQAARLVLLGNGANPVSGALDHAGDQLATLTAYNQRTAQVEADLQRLTAENGGGSAVAALAGEVTEYHQIADAAVALDQATPSVFPDTMGASSGQPAAAAIGYYARATTLMQSRLLPEASALRDETANALADTASSARLAGFVGASVAGAIGLLAVVLASRLHRRLRLWFRRTLNPGVFTAMLLALALAIGGIVALVAAARDTSNAAGRFADYLAVSRTRSASYDVDGAVTRHLLMPDTTDAQLTKALSTATGQLSALGPAGAQASARWKPIVQAPQGDIPAIIGGSDVSTALARDTGTARGDEAFDFSYFDSALVAVSHERLAAFDASMAAAGSDLSGWSWLPWLLAGAALTALGLGVRARLAEFR